MTHTDEMREKLCWFYTASYGGTHELAGSIDSVEKLAENGYVSSSRCNTDPLSSHRAKTCRIILTRMTEKGISEAKTIINNRLKHATHFFESLNSHPEKIRDVYKVLLRQWLEACEVGTTFNWSMRNRKAHQGGYLPFPDNVKETISSLTSLLVEKGLAVQAPIDHNTSGPLDAVLMTCPEVQNRILIRNERVDVAVFDEYLKYLLDGLSMIRAKFRLLHFFSINGKKVENHRLRWISQKFGVSIESLLDWLKELEGCGYLSTFNENSIDFSRSHEVYSSEDILVATGDPWRFFYSPRSDITKIENNVKTNLEKWFENGVETFTRFEYRKS